MMFIWLFVLSAQVFAANDAYLQAKKISIANKGFRTDVSEVELKIIDSSGSSVSRFMKSSIIETSEGSKNLIEFTQPATVRGAKYLMWGYEIGENSQWIFVPALRTVKRIVGSENQNSFMGSEFSYEDLGQAELEKFTYSSMTSGSLGKRDSWVITRVPKSKDSTYSRQVLWYDKVFLVALRTEFYNQRNELVKIALATDIKQYGQWYRATKIEMKNLVSRRSSALQWKNRIFGRSIVPSLFDPKRLK
jgi:hypothetical protein